MYILCVYICLTLYFQFQTVNLTLGTLKWKRMFGSNERNVCRICGNNMQLVLLHCQIYAKYMETGKQSKKGYCISTVIATNCTSSYKSYRMYRIHSLRWQWLIILRLYLYLLALGFGTLTYLAFQNHHVNHVDMDASLQCHSKLWCIKTIPYYFFLFCFAFMVCKQVYFVLKVEQTPVLVRKKYQQQKHRKQTKTKG